MPDLPRGSLSRKSKIQRGLGLLLLSLGFACLWGAVWAWWIAGAERFFPTWLHGLLFAVPPLIVTQIYIMRQIDKGHVEETISYQRWNDFIFDSVAEGILVLDEQGLVESLNRASCRLLALSTEEARGRDVKTLLLPVGDSTLINRSKLTGESALIGANRTLKVRTLDKHEAVIDVTFTKVRLDRLIRYVGLVRDVTERFHAQERASRYASVLEASPALVCIFDQNEELLTINPAGRRLLKLSDDEFFPRKRNYYLKDFLLLSDFQEHRKVWMPCAMTHGSWSGQTRMVRSDQVQVPVYLVLVVHKNESDHFQQISLTAHDFTQLEQARAELTRLNAELQQALTLAQRLAYEAELANKAKSLFLANTSHEIRTPLTAILGYSDMMNNGDLDPIVRKKSLVGIQRCGRHLLGVINNILDFSRIEANKLELEWLRVDPREITLDVIDALRPQAEGKNLLLNVHQETQLPQLMETDPTRLRQVLVNLIGNAIKFSNHGTIHIRVVFEEEPGWIPLPKHHLNPTDAHDFDRSSGFARRDWENAVSGSVSESGSEYVGGWLRFYVQDQGPGIAPDILNTLFQPFQQGDSTTTRRFGGSGLGLSIAHYLVRALGGEIHVRSVLGQGSTFAFSLPVSKSDAQVCNQADTLQDNKTRNTHSTQENASMLASATAGIRPLDGRVLLVEDGADNQLVLCYYLKYLGLTVEVAENGKEGLEKALSRNYPIILMDIAMPIMDGHEATRKLRAAGYALPIVALTANATREELRACRQSGFTDFLTKPVDLEVMLSTLRHLMEHNSPAPNTIPIDADSQPAVNGDNHDNALNPLTHANFRMNEYESTLTAYNENPTTPSHPEETIDDHENDDADDSDEFRDDEEFRSLREQFQFRLYEIHHGLRQAYLQNDWETLAKDARQLTDAAAMYNIMDISALAGQLEDAAKNQNAATNTYLEQLQLLIHEILDLRRE